MAKRFSLVDCGDKQVVMSGFIESDILHTVPEIVELLAKTSSYENASIIIFHMLFLDFPDAPITDATPKEVEILQADLPKFFDAGWVETLEEIELTVRGISKDIEMVEAGDV